MRRDSKTRSLRADYGRSKGKRGKCETYTARTVVQKLNEKEKIVVARKNGSKWSFSSSGQTRGKFAYQRNLAIMNKKREERLKGPLLLLYRDRLRREGRRGALVSPFPPFSSFVSPFQKRRQKRKRGRGLTKTSAPSQTAAGLAKKSARHWRISPLILFFRQ